MPSPFPGMDPYVEDPEFWPDFHQSFITYMRNVIQPQVRPRYHARIGERVYVVTPEDQRPFYPDVAVVEHPRAHARRVEEAQGRYDVPLIALAPEMEVREPFLEIIDAATGGKVITVVELLSPSNKSPGSEGHELYKRKQEEVLESEASLVEIDLLRAGPYVLAYPHKSLMQYRLEGRRWDYPVCISRAALRPEQKFELYLIPLRQRLPRIVIPLKPEDADIGVDLQAIFQRCYEDGAYEDLIDYRRSPDTPIAPEDATWVESLVRERQARA